MLLCYYWGTGHFLIKLIDQNWNKQIRDLEVPYIILHNELEVQTSLTSSFVSHVSSPLVNIAFCFLSERQCSV